MQELPKNMTKAEMQKELHCHGDTLDDMDARGDGPPRFKANSRVWLYPVDLYLKWREQRLAAFNPVEEAKRKQPRQPAKRRQREDHVST